MSLDERQSEGLSGGVADGTSAQPAGAHVATPTIDSTLPSFDSDPNAQASFQEGQAALSEEEKHRAGDSAQEPDKRSDEDLAETTAGAPAGISVDAAIDAAVPALDVPTASETGSIPVARRARGVPANVEPAIFFDNVTKVYDSQPDHAALENINLKVFPGEFVFLVGHSGSGKSTFIRLINREISVTSGDLYVAGENLSEIRNWRVPFLRRNIGCVFQDFKLLPKKTAYENVAFALEVIGKSKHIIKTQVPEVLRLVGLEDKLDKYPDQLSGGEQQRVSIARAIVNRPPLLICDEPTGNLDPQTSLGIMRLLDRINRTGTIVLVATHDKEMVNSMRRRVVALDDGHIIRDQDRGVYGIDA